MGKILLSLFFIFIAVQAMAADEWLKTRPASTDTRISWPADSQANNAAIDRLLANYREGMTLTYSSATTISVTAGSVTCSNSAGTVRKMRLNTSATNVTFADIDTGAEASGTTYYIYASCDADAETAVFKVSASSTAPTGVTYYKRLGSFYNNSSSDIANISNDNDVDKLAAKESKTVGTSYFASTDGFASLFGDSSSVRGQQLACYSDATSTPTTLVGRAGSGSDQGSGASITVPVRAGDYYRCTWSATDSGSGTMYWYPLN